jgi:DNA-binding NarL/FixJ family response regulator
MKSLVDKNIRVFVADVYPIIRKGLITTIASEPQMHVVGSGAHTDDLTEVMASSSVDVVVVNFVRMDDGLVAGIHELRQKHPRLAIVVVASAVDFAPELLAAGVLAYTSYAEPDDQLHLAIRAAKARQRFVSPVVQDYLDRCATMTAEHRFVPRELEVIKCIVLGLNNEEIGKYLEIDLGTVRNYVSRIRKKSGWTTWPQIVSWYNTTYGRDRLPVIHKSAR